MASGYAFDAKSETAPMSQVVPLAGPGAARSIELGRAIADFLVAGDVAGRWRDPAPGASMGLARRAVLTCDRFQSFGAVRASPAASAG
jgi:hypothetical protein